MLRRLNSRFSTILPKWQGETAVILGGGPSLTRKQCDQVHGVHCIAVNAAYLLAPWADVCYFADSHFWKWHHDGVDIPRLGLTADCVRRLFHAFPGQKCTIQNSGANVTDDAVHMLRNKTYPEHAMGLSLDPEALLTGRNSGFQAMNIAVLAGAKRILLLGFDGQPVGGRDQFHDGHKRPTPAAAYPYYLQAMVAAENALIGAGVRVLNCTPGSVIDSFEKMDLSEALQEEATFG